jgi:endonuclease/exonuclease/phosphatase (EEP) superfamily protein YafD
MLIWTLGIFCAVLVFLTLLPLSGKTVWWVRGADFPRAQFVVIGLAILAASSATFDSSRTATGIIAALTLLCIVYQLWWIWPYTRLHTKEVKTAAAHGDRVRIMSVNVLMTNRHAGDLLRLVQVEQPDVLVTLETNAWWEREMNSLEVDYPHTLKCPLENLYGMHLYSRFPLEDPKIQFLVEEGVPSMHLLLVLPSGRRIELHCLHPAPPSPTENPTSRERDAELVMVGRSVEGSEYPVVVCGDLNDVAWSATTRLFRKVSGLLDPRIGRGMFNTFHAHYFFMRWPVDHVFHSKHFSLVKLVRLGPCGSDHFPMLVELAVDEQAFSEQEGLTADAQDEAEAEEKMEKKDVSGPQVHQPGRRGGQRGHV